ncbi:hypothetical protein CYY_007022 [Polysphondylium violaceum]|uniref:Signal peptidase complex subunit 3 n=1 Tax=Polysphondylium violaceum TaxID=133409 RepID=A0A8J4UYA7_9MYCE|nr:hypothetical protein CYY_007022 [Polysphondylium violaceum]
MYSITQRANTIICFGGMVLFGVLLLNVLSRAFFPNHVDVDIKLNSVTRLNKRNSIEYAEVHFDLQTDLRPLFNWNTKMLFLYVVAEYQTKQNVISQEVLWDHILMDKEKANIDVKNIFKYYLVDQGLGLRNNTINLTFNYNVIPISGLLTRHKDGSHQFKLNDRYLLDKYY